MLAQTKHRLSRLLPPDGSVPNSLRLTGNDIGEYVLDRGRGRTDDPAFDRNQFFREEQGESSDEEHAPVTNDCKSCGSRACYRTALVCKARGCGMWMLMIKIGFLNQLPEVFDSELVEAKEKYPEPPFDSSYSSAGTIARLVAQAGLFKVGSMQHHYLSSQHSDVLKEYDRQQTVREAKAKRRASRGVNHISCREIEACNALAEKCVAGELTKIITVPIGSHDCLRLCEGPANCDDPPLPQCTACEAQRTSELRCCAPFQCKECERRCCMTAGCWNPQNELCSHCDASLQRPIVKLQADCSLKDAAAASVGCSATTAPTAHSSFEEAHVYNVAVQMAKVFCRSQVSLDSIKSAAEKSGKHFACAVLASIQNTLMQKSPWIIRLCGYFLTENGRSRQAKPSELPSWIPGKGLDRNQGKLPHTASGLMGNDLAGSGLALSYEKAPGDNYNVAVWQLDRYDEWLNDMTGVAKIKHARERMREAMKAHWTRTILEDATDDNGHLMVDQEELDRRLEAKLAEDARVTAERVDIRAEAAWRQIMMDDWTEMPKRFRQAMPREEDH